MKIKIVNPTESVLGQAGETVGSCIGPALMKVSDRTIPDFVAAIKVRGKWFMPCQDISARHLEEQFKTGKMFP